MEIQTDFKELLELLNIHWDEASSSKVKGQYGDIPVYYIGIDQFIKNKRAIGRKKDLADLEALGIE